MRYAGFVVAAVAVGVALAALYADYRGKRRGRSPGLFPKLLPVSCLLGIVTAGLIAGRIVAGVALAGCAMGLVVVNIVLIYRNRKYGRGMSSFPVLAAFLGLAAVGCLLGIRFFSEMVAAGSNRVTRC